MKTKNSTTSKFFGQLRYILASIILCPYLILCLIWMRIKGEKIKPGSDWNIIHSFMMIAIGLIFYFLAAVVYVIYKIST